MSRYSVGVVWGVHVGAVWGWSVGVCSVGVQCRCSVGVVWCVWSVRYAVWVCVVSRCGGVCVEYGVA